MAESLIHRTILSIHWTLAGLSYGVINYRHPARAAMLETARTCQQKTHSVTMPVEGAEIYSAVKACEKVPGDMAEAGVYLGGSARLLLTASSTKRIHLFDTFEGLPTSEGVFKQGEYAGAIPVVKQNLSEFESRLIFHPGLFPASTAGLDDLRFSFVHLDLDLYEPTRAALEWFWPRMNPGGILLSHDYPFADGVVKAFHEFFADRPEPFLPLSGNQCLAIKP